MSEPRRRDKTRPLELVGLSAIFGVFTGFVVTVVTRDLVLGIIFGGVAFIVALVIFAMLALAVRGDTDGRTHLYEDPSDGPDGPRAH
ncbi:hypothetical protein [Desertivibrio insolitus]|uniref:hypothetical protein n=1 Tax=Herbiconiux sp. SYSU D00978 TaxID=2812562 RepID=UPI001A95927C|nr:hypothetical protein [Herbiconiux sp. SYSU D00978]